MKKAVIASLYSKETILHKEIPPEILGYIIYFKLQVHYNFALNI